MPDWLAAVIPARPVAALAPIPLPVYETAALPGSGLALAATSPRVYGGDAAQYRIMDSDVDADAGFTQTQAVLPPSQELPKRSARGRPHYYPHSPAVSQTNNKRRRSRSKSSSPTRPYFPISFHTSSRLQDPSSPPILQRSTLAPSTITSPSYHSASPYRCIRHLYRPGPRCRMVYPSFAQENQNQCHGEAAD